MPAGTGAKPQGERILLPLAARRLKASGSYEKACQVGGADLAALECLRT